MVRALDEAHRTAFAVDNTHPDGIRGPLPAPQGAWCGRQRDLFIAEGNAGRPSYKRDHDVTIADTETPADGLHAQMHILASCRSTSPTCCASRCRDEQRRRPWVRRRVYSVPRVLEPQGRAPLRAVPLEITQSAGCRGGQIPAIARASSPRPSSTRAGCGRRNVAANRGCLKASPRPVPPR